MTIQQDITEDTDIKPSTISIIAYAGANIFFNNYSNNGWQPKVVKVEEKGKAEMKEEKTETAEEHQHRKERAIKDITKRFDFKDDMLASDNENHQYTNERIAVLFRKCLGVGSYPSIENRQLMHQLGGLLIDSRNQCTKRVNEDYFRQTVLNIIGYFVLKNIIHGPRLAIAQCVFADADSNMARNIDRNVTSNVFPRGITAVLDMYIDKMTAGEF